MNRRNISWESVMKITQIECLILDKSFPYIAIVIHTDEGLVGIGECFRRNPTIAKSVIANILRSSLLGKNPLHIDSKYRGMMIATNALEMGGVICIAIAGIDIAPWDIKGRSLDLPIYQLLRGKIRDQVLVR